MGQVDPNPMTSDAATVAGAIAWGYQQMKGTAAPAQVVLWALALSANETASWQSLYNYNLGNVTTGGSVDWYANPRVTAPLKFVSYASLGDGAIGMLRAMDASGMLAAAANGDMDAFRTGQARYQGTSNPPDLSGLIARYQSVVPASYSSGLLASHAVLLSVGIASVAAATIYAITTGFFDGLRVPTLDDFGLARENPAQDRDPPPMYVQSLLFPLDQYNVPMAKAWAKRHEYRTSKVEVTDKYIHLVQTDPGHLRVIRTVEFGHGIKAHVGREAA